MNDHSPDRVRPQRGGALGRLADTAFTKPRRILLAWGALLAVAIVAMVALGGPYVADYNTPGSDSQAASELLGERFAGRSGDQVDVVWKAADASEAAALNRVEGVIGEAEKLDGVVPGATAKAAEIAADGHIGVVRLPLDRPASTMASADGEHLAELADQADGGGVEVAIGARFPASSAARDDLGAGRHRGRGAGPAAHLRHRGRRRAATPGGAFRSRCRRRPRGALAGLIDTPDWSLQVSLMIGIGVGIDYALLILTRYRTALHAGNSRVPRPGGDGHGRPLGDDRRRHGGGLARRAFLMRLPYSTASRSPRASRCWWSWRPRRPCCRAILGLLGRRIDRWQVRSFGLRVKDPDRSRAASWARLVTGRPLTAAIGALVVLAVLALPLTGIRFGFPDAGNDAAGTSTREAYDLMVDGFGPGANGPLIVVADTPGAEDQTAMKRLAAEIATEPGRRRGGAAAVQPGR